MEAFGFVVEHFDYWTARTIVECVAMSIAGAEMWSCQSRTARWEGEAGTLMRRDEKEPMPCPTRFMMNAEVMQKHGITRMCCGYH